MFCKQSKEYGKDKEKKIEANMKQSLKAYFHNYQ